MLDDGSPIYSPETRRPFAESAIGKLPDELLLRIASYAVIDARSLARMASICSVLRTIVVGEADLWADIDITRHSEQILDWVRLCLSRAGSCPISLRATLNSIGAYDALRDVSAQVEGLDLKFIPGMIYSDSSFHLVRQTQLRPPHLRFLRLRGEIFTRSTIGPDAMEMIRQIAVLIGGGSQNNPLTSDIVFLSIHGGIVGGVVPNGTVPSLPKLVHLELQRATISAQRLYSMLQGSPNLRTLLLALNMGAPEPFASDAYMSSLTTQRLQLPLLRTLRMVASVKYTVDLLEVLPDPHSQLEIKLVASETSEQFEDLEPIIARVRHHWATVGHEPSLPDGRLQIFYNQGELTALVTFGQLRSSTSSQQRMSLSSDDRPSVFFSVEYDLLERYLLLEEVQSVYVDLPSKDKQTAGPRISRLQLEECLDMYSIDELPILDTLVIRHASLSDDLGEYHQVAKLLLDRQEAGFAKIALQLQRCEGPWHQVISQLEAAGLVTSVTCT
jgi:hypothetical protein